MTPQELRERTSDFAKRVMHLTGPLLARPDASDIARQLRKAAMSVSANYRAAGRARSHKEFTAKIGVVREEVDESLHWLALMRECSLAVGEELDALTSEAEELVRIFARSFETAKRKEREAKEKSRDRAMEDRAMEDRAIGGSDD